MGTLNYAMLYIEAITGIYTPLQSVRYATWSTWLVRWPATAVFFHYVVISWNRTHAIFFPLHYRNFWVGIMRLYMIHTHFRRCVCHWLYRW